MARETSGGQTIDTEVLYPSMYFGLEKKRYDNGGDVENSHCAVNNVYLNGVRIAAVLPSGKAFYYLTDQVDSVKVVVSDSGMPVSRMEYLPFGDTWFQEGDLSHNPKYNSQELDKETGYYFYNARHYDAGMSRFVTPDTVIDGEMSTQGWNRYAYCHNNPVLYKDPSGHFILGAVVGGVLDGALEAASQVAEGMAEGKSFSDSVKDIDVKEVAKEAAKGAAIGLVTGGIGNIAKALKGAKTVAKCAKAIKKVESAAGKALKKSDKVYNKAMKIASKSSNFKTGVNKAVFYSGKGNPEKALKHAKNVGKTTIDQTKGGKKLEALADLYEKL